MVTIPRAQRTVTGLRPVPSVTPTATPSLEAFGGGQVAQLVSGSSQKLLGQAESMVKEEKKNADEVVINEAWDRAIKKRNERMYDNKSGVITRKGKAAIGVVDEYSKLYEQDLDEIENELTNDDQRVMFSKVRAQQARNFGDDLQKHTVSEFKRYEKETYDSSLAIAKEDAVLNYQNPGRVRDSIESQKVVILNNARKNGLSPEETKVVMDNEISGTHSAVIQRMLANKQDLAAKQYFEKAKDEMKGADVTRIEASIKEGSVRGESQRKATEIMAQGGSLREALDEARKIQDPDVQDATVREVKLRFSENDQVKQQANEQRMQYSMLQVENTRELPDPVMFQAMSKQEQDAISSRLEQVRTGKPAQTDPEIYYKLKGMASNPSSQPDFASENLLLYRHKLGQAEYNELNELQAGIRKGNLNTKKQLDGVRSDQQIIVDTLKTAGINPEAKAGTDEAKQSAAFRRRVDEEILKLQERTGKKATNDEIQRIADNEMMQVITDKGWIWNTKKHRFEVTPEEKFEIDPKDIPRSERQRIEEALRRRNLPITDERVLELYLVKIKG